MKMTHCVACGNSHDQDQFPKKCAGCQHEMFVNPIPVVILLVPVLNKGVLIQKRGISPGLGQMALISGYVDNGETPEQAAIREAQEECGLKINSATFRGFAYGDSKKNLLILMESHTVDESAIKFLPNPEVFEISYANSAQELAFGAHTEFLKNYLNYSKPSNVRYDYGR